MMIAVSAARRTAGFTAPIPILCGPILSAPKYLSAAVTVSSSQLKNLTG
jgi:hypothetical protein